MHLKCLNLAFIWVVKIRNTSEAVFRPHEPLGHTDCDPMGLGQYNGLGAYCGPYTASSVFLVLLLMYSEFIIQLPQLFIHEYPSIF